jgi:hypothetical protein
MDAFLNLFLKSALHLLMPYLTLILGNKSSGDFFKILKLYHFFRNRLLNFQKFNNFGDNSKEMFLKYLLNCV